MGKPAVSPETFSTFGDLLKYLRKREELTQRELALLVGYSDTQISRLEQNQRVPDAATLTALFVPALHLEREPQWVERLLELAKQARLGELPETGKTINPNNLPASLTTFIGREKEQAEILPIDRHASSGDADRIRRGWQNPHLAESRRADFGRVCQRRLAGRTGTPQRPRAIAADSRIRVWDPQPRPLVPIPNC